MWKMIIVIHLMSGACVARRTKVTDEPLLLSMKKAMRTFYEPMWFLDPDYDESVRLKHHVLNPMFSAARDFMRTVTRDRAYPPRAGLVPYPYNRVQFGQLLKEWPKMVEHYTFIVFLVAVVALLLVALPILCVFWSCYWCVRGNRPERADPPRRRRFLCGFSALLALYLCGVVLVFESESAVQCAAGDAFVALHRGVNDSVQFLAHTQYFLEWLLMHSFSELRRRSLFITRALGEMAAANLTMNTRAVSMNRISSLVDRLEFMKASYGYLRTKTDGLRSDAQQLNEGLQSIQRQIHKALSTCDQLDCADLRDSEKLRLLDNGIYLDEMADVSEKMEQVSALLAGRLRDEVAEGVNVLRDLQHSVRRAALAYVPLVTQILNAIAHYLTTLVQKFRAVMRKLIHTLVLGHREVDKLSQHFHRYGAFRQYIGVGAAIALLMIFAIMLWGVLLCACGTDTVSCRTAGCCDRTTGASTLIWGVRVILVVTGFVALTLIIYFIIAVVIQRFVCDPYWEPRNNRVFMDMEKLLGTGAMLESLGCGTLNLTTVLVRIHQNLTLFQVLNIQELLDLEELSALIRATTRRLNALPPLRPVLGDNIVFLKEPTIKKLRHCADAQLLDFNFEEFRSAIHLRVSPRQLQWLAHELNRTALTLRTPQYEREAFELMQASARLATLANSILRPALRTVRDLTRMDDAFPPSLMAYAELLNQGYDISDLAQLIEKQPQDKSSQKGEQSMDPLDLVDDVQQAEESLESQGERVLKTFVNETLFKIRVKIISYMEGVRHVLAHDAAPAGPVSRILNATANAICQDLLLPMNGYWLSLFLCLALLPGVALTAQRVARLHLRVRVCPGHAPRSPIVLLLSKMWRICVTAFICTASWFINQSVEAEQTESTTTIFAFVNFTNFTNYTTTAYTFMVPTQPHLLFVEQSQRRSNYTQMFHDTKYDRILYPTPHVLHTLFTIGQDIAKVLSKSNAYPRGFVAGNFNATLSNVMKKWPRLISHYGTIVSYLIFAAVLMAIMPLVGLVWCCHWLVWGRHRHSRGTCPRRWSTFVIFMLIILVFLACLVCVFESESSLECGIEELATTLPLVNEDLRQYFRMLQEYLDWLVSQAFTDLRNNVDSVMHGLGQMSEAVFTNETRAVAVEAINDIVSRLDFMGSLFQQAREHTNVLRTHADQFNTGLQSVKRQVLRALATCDQIECMRLRDSDKLRLLYTEIYFDEAPDLARKQNYVKEMLNSNIQRDTGDAVKVLRAIQHKVQASTSRFTPVVDKYMQQIDDHLSGIRQVIATGKDAIVNETLVLSAALDYLQYMYRRTGPFRQHVGIGVAMCLLSILVLMVWGVTCIIFGRQPASCRTDPECFDKIAGSKSLIWGIRLSFVFAGIVALTSAVYFMVAIFIQRFYCDPIMEPRNNRVVNDMFRFKKPEFFDKIGLLQEFDVVDLIERCHQNMTFIQILELEDALNEMELQNVIMSMAAWVELIPPLRLDVGKDFHFLTPAAKKKLFQCVENEVFIMDVAAYRSAVQLRVSPSELELLARELNRTARSLKRPRFEQQSRELMHASEQVTKLVHNVLRQINSNFQLPNGMTLNEAADKYKKGEMDYSELSEMNLGSEMTGGQSIVEMVLSILAAEEQVRNQSMIETQKFIDETFANLKQRVADYVVGVLYLLKHDTGRCGPVSRLYNVTAALMCNGVLLPLNGYWLSLAVCLVMLVPLTMLAKSVARFYMDVRPCPAHYQPPTSWFSKFKCCQ